MGIYHFYSWFRGSFRPCIRNVKASSGPLDSAEGLYVDTLAVDFNALIHGSTQKVYRYGAYKPKSEDPIRRPPLHVLQRRVHEDVCKTINTLVALVRPTKRLILCVDGPAPYAKMVQQRKRRFRSAKDSDTGEIFDSNAITPGTKFMDSLTRHVDWHIRLMMSIDSVWSGIEEVVFSNEKVAGEGEAKIFEYLRTRIGPSETVVIHGADSDIIMLSLGSGHKNIWVLRDDQYDLNRNFFLVDIGSARDVLVDMLEWFPDKAPLDTERDKSLPVFSPKVAVDDFVFLCFLVGNDFLPHVPSLEIIESGVEIIMEAYRRTGRVHGHITKRLHKGDSRWGSHTTFNKTALATFLMEIASFEPGLLDKKIGHRSEYFPDALLEFHSKLNDETGEHRVDINGYRGEYTKTHFRDSTEEACEAYLDGLNWVISYYKHGIPSWNWYYPHSHAPLAEDLARACEAYKIKNSPRTFPMLPYMQLMAVLPPKSSPLLPFPLSGLLVSGDYADNHCPEEFEIDLSGKRNDWQGLVLLPDLHPKTVSDTYNAHKDKIAEVDLKRNRFGRAFVYTHTTNPIVFHSSIGTISPCFANRELL